MLDFLSLDRVGPKKKSENQRSFKRIASPRKKLEQEQIVNSNHTTV